MKRIGLKDVGSCPDVGLTVVSFAPTFDSVVGPALAPALVPSFAPAFPVVVPPAVEGGEAVEAAVEFALTGHSFKTHEAMTATKKKYLASILSSWVYLLIV